MSESTTNPLLAKIRLPGRIFQLPSRGIFYTNGELDDSVKDGEIHFHPMTALDEINMKNPDQLFSGRAVQEVLPRCCPQIKKPGELLSKDIDAVMLFLRTVTYGGGFDIIVKHSCESGKDHSYTVDIEKVINEATSIDPTTTVASYNMTMPNDQVIKLQPSRYMQVIELIKHNQSRNELTVLDVQKNLIDMLAGIIVSVDDIVNPDMIREWLQSIPAPWANRIADKVDSVNSWGPNLTVKIACKDCGQDFDVDVPINPVSFFTE